MVHQLDYATSGVLLIGKTRKSAAAACKSFEERKTLKKYVAVVTANNNNKNISNNFLDTTIASSTSTTDPSNILPLPPLGQDFFDNLPILPLSSLDSWRDGTLEKQYKKKRQRDTNTERFMPIHSVFDKWRSTLLKKRKEREQQKKKQVLAKALGEGPEEDMPVRAVLRGAAPVTLYWCP